MEKPVDVEAQPVHRNSAAAPHMIRRDPPCSPGSSITCIDTNNKFARQDSAFSSGASTLAPNQLEKRQTLKVEDEALHGYPRLATLLGTTENYAIYRRFAALNARNLLYHQAKLTHLEHELHDLEQAHLEHADLRYNVHHLFSKESHDEESPGYVLRCKYEEVSRVLEKYNKLLLEQSRLHELSKPDHVYVNTIANFINSEKDGKPDWLQHPDNTIYGVWDDNREPIQGDLVTLNRAFREQDAFTRFFTSTFLIWWHRIYSRFRAPDGTLDEYVYGDKKTSRYMRAIVMIIASALPTCSIVALYFIESSLWRLGFIIMFSGVFASALSFFTEAKSIEVFTASVALASVQVVFVGTTFGNGSRDI